MEARSRCLQKHKEGRWKVGAGGAGQGVSKYQSSGYYRGRTTSSDGWEGVRAVPPRYGVPALGNRQRGRRSSPENVQVQETT